MVQSIVKNGKIKVLPYTAAQLSTVYRVCKRTFLKWLEPFENEIGPRTGNFYTIAQVRLIFKKLDLPSEITLEE